LFWQACATVPGSGKYNLNFFRSNKFSAFGTIFASSPGGVGNYSFNLLAAKGETKIFLADEFGNSVAVAPFIRRMKDEIVSILKGRYPEFLRKIKRKKSDYVFLFSKNKMFLKKMRVSVGRKNEIRKIFLKFKRGFCEIEFREFVYEN